MLFTTFVADIGPVRAGNLWGPSLHYAVVGGVAYGTPELVIAEPGGPLTATDAVAALPDDQEIALANLTAEPVVLDSLVMHFADLSGVSTWRVDSMEPPYVFCSFAPFEPRLTRCALGVSVPPGVVIQLQVGYDPCAVCRPADDSGPARRGGARDTLLVYSGGVAVPDTVWFDASGYIGTEEAPAPAGLALAVGPNPSAGRARVTITAAEPVRSVRVTLIDALGRRVAVLHDGALPADARFTVPPNLPAGVYTVRAEAGDASATARLTIVR
jgi:hypothetical protein